MPDFRTCPKCGRESAAWRFNCPTCGNTLIYTKKVTVEIRDDKGELDDLIEDIQARNEGKPTKQRSPRQVTKREITIQRDAPLERAVAANIDGLSGSCADMLDHRQALWTFVAHADVEPTNNHAEREIRAFVLWRKRSYGTQSDRGNLFAERVMTVAHTARKQNKNVLAFLTACCRARAGSGSRPSLFVPDAAVAA